MSKKFSIPFNRPSLVGHEMSYMAEAVARGHISGDGVFTSKCQDLLQRALNVPAALLTTSCTDALELAALLLNIQPGDEVVVPSFTFVSSVNAFVLRGARPVFVDIRADTLNLDANLLEAAISPRTKAILVVHYAGIGCEMSRIMEIATRHGIAVVEDNAHGLWGKFGGQHLGTFGLFAVQSFHETKNISCGEGGALIINDAAQAERAEILRQKGTDRSRFLRGEVDQYTWVDVGSSYAPSDLLAAFLLAQLERKDEIQRTRRRIWERYYSALSDWAVQNGARLPVVPAECEHPYHIFYLVLPSACAQEKLIAHLKSRGVLAVFHYQPLHLSAMGGRFGGTTGQCPVTEAVSGRLLRLPFFFALSEAEQSYVIDAVHSAGL